MTDIGVYVCMYSYWLTLYGGCSPPNQVCSVLSVCLDSGDEARSRRDGLHDGDTPRQAASRRLRHRSSCLLISYSLRPHANPGLYCSLYDGGHRTRQIIAHVFQWKRSSYVVRLLICGSPYRGPHYEMGPFDSDPGILTEFFHPRNGWSQF